MEPSHGVPVDARAHSQNVVNNMPVAYFPRRTNLPPPDSEREEVFARVTKSESRLAASVQASFAAVPNRLKKIFTFKSKKGESSLELRGRFRDSKLERPSNSAAVPEPKGYVLEHSLPRLTRSWYQENPGWERYEPDLQVTRAVSSTQDLGHPSNSAAVEKPKKTVLKHKLPRLTRSWYLENPGWERYEPDLQVTRAVSSTQDLGHPSNSAAVEKPKKTVLKHKLPRLTRSWYQENPGWERYEPDLQVTRAVSSTQDLGHPSNSPAVEKPKKTVLKHSSPHLTRSWYQENPGLEGYGPNILGSSAVSSTQDLGHPSNSAAVEQPKESLHKHSSPRLTRSWYQENPGLDRPITNLDVPVEAARHSLARPRKAHRRRPLPLYNDDPEYRLSSEWTREPAEYETNPARDSLGQDFDQVYCTGDHQTLDHEHQQSLTRRSSDVSALEQHQASDNRLVHAALVTRQPLSQVNMDDTRASVVLDTASVRDSVMTSQKFAAIKIAKEQEKAIHEKLRRNGHEIPKYEFQELIGKGAYGRVFKCFDQEHNRVVALKVIDVDTTDYKVNARAKDDTIYDTVHEIKVLSQLKDSKAKNVNTMFDAFQVHSQLWIVNDYCPGGSVHTLMRATGNKLEDRYIVPIARELAVALRAVHAAGIIHRDVKSANVMIHENGSLQVIDFGVAGVLQTKVDKRSTVIGTPHWMPPELHRLAPPQGLTYGTEVDVWAYGCTLYEIATGNPPNCLIEPGRRLGATLGRTPPRLDRACFSEGLCDLIAFVLEAKPADRPSMEAVLEQKYLVDTEETHPTTSLAELVKAYYRWERSGGHRHSLFFQGGAPAVEFPETLDSEGSWNFSLTENFEQHFVDSEYLSQTSGLAPSTNADSAADNSFDSYPLSPTPAVFTPSTSPRLQLEMSSSSETPRMTDHPATENEAYNEERVKRGEQAMQGLFDENKASYKYEVKNDFNKQRARQPMRLRSDLPLRHETEQSSLSHNELEVRARSSETDSMPNIDLANVNTIRANRLHRLRDFSAEEETSEPQYGNQSDDRRATLDFGWTFPQALPATTTTMGTETEEPVDRATVAPPLPALPLVSAPPHPHLLRAQTAPIHQLSIDSHQSAILDLDELYDSDALYERTSRVTSDEEPEHHTAAEPNHQELSDAETEENKSTTSTDGSLAFDYGPSNAEISEHSTTSSDNEADSGDDYHPSPPRSLVFPQPMPPRPLVFPEPMPPSAAAMRDGASAAIVQAELTRLLTGFTHGMDVLAQAFARVEGEEDGEEMGGEANGEGEE